jgi:cold-inducible RNA-binding protein
METKLYVGNLPRSMMAKEIDALFGQAGDVTAVHIITDRLTGFSRGYAYVTMSAQSEADKAVSMFNTFAWEDQRLKVTLVNPRASRGVAARF